MILAFYGSPHKNGNTSYVADKVTEGIGNVKKIYAYDENIKSCIDCGECRKGKCIYDDMDEIYYYLKRADIVIIASPLYFSAPSGRLADIFSRLQFFHNNPFSKPESKGILIFTGGGSTKTLSVPISIGKAIFCSIGIKNVDSIIYANTDNAPACESSYVKNEINRIREKILHCR